MLSANFKPKTTAAASRGFLATARLSYNNFFTITFYNELRKKPFFRRRERMASAPFFREWRKNGAILWRHLA